MGKLICAYRNHPSHGSAIPQAAVARWAGISQAQLSRIESGRPIRDLERLIRWANTLHIPQRLLWFDLDDLGPADGGNDDAALGIQIVQLAPLSVLKPTLSSLSSIRSLLEQRQPTRQQVRLLRATAILGTVTGEILFNTGQFKRAYEWYKAAEHAAYDVGDRYLLDIALAGQAYLPTYSDNPRGVLALLQPRLEAAKALPTPALSWLWAFKARAHASLGEAEEFRRAIAKSQDALDNSQAELVRPGIFSFLPEKLAFYEATGAVQLNKPEVAVAAADRALSLYDLSETTEPTLARLERASALALAREIPEACHAAIEALLDPSTYHGVTVRTYAARFDGLVKGIQSPDTREWREVHAEQHRQPWRKNRT